ncbi:ankyrin repeat-containing protein YAR1, putative [Entamoeba dispar SAW760]|uniref:Ankyrin repeat-containing protein YAR1, putative n=1 Tax=Entamoeba dispar (strain ATCC PRA-260 / SAW760) TaxID=370354 RepID=B0EQN7_ENTDS|nr:ankyrin repeat-containing protein YAR1, putative [Entamoeba dispar SAW760]EDR23156.1 ankyrin repeat-containing protein YAR1, putative [Entamoeba dispar SAW760]|eukprot:EDR23156.1 ankyrin repeat-containing protein YAR1, putative [Entamoeba dispar SAW760]
MQTNGFDVESVNVFLEEVRYGEMEIVKSFIEQDHDILTVKNEYGNSALHYSCGNNNVEMTSFLLSFDEIKGIVNDKNESGSTALHWAVRGDIQIVQMMLDAGADKTILNAQNKTAIELAAEEHKDDIVALLIGPVADDLVDDDNEEKVDDEIIVESISSDDNIQTKQETKEEKTD